MTTLVNSCPSLDLATLIGRINNDITQASMASDCQLAHDRLTIAKFLHQEVGSLRTRDLVNRASAVCRFVGGRNHG